MNVGGQSFSVRISDLSQEGVRVVLDEGMRIDTEQEIELGVGAINPNIKGRVRWIGQNVDNPHQQELGIEFESFMIVRPNEQEVTSLLSAWQEISQAYDLFESFLRILFLIDFEVVDGKIINLSDAVYSIGVWMNQHLGPLNLWSLMREQDQSITVSPLVINNPIPKGEEALRIARVSQVAQGELTEWFDGQPYLFGGDVVIEYLGEKEEQTDLLQRLVVLLSRRLQFWSKVLMKNISLNLLGDELERVQNLAESQKDPD